MHIAENALSWKAAIKNTSETQSLFHLLLEEEIETKQAFFIVSRQYILNLRDFKTIRQLFNGKHFRQTKKVASNLWKVSYCLFPRGIRSSSLFITHSVWHGIDALKQHWLEPRRQSRFFPGESEWRTFAINDSIIHIYPARICKVRHKRILQECTCVRKYASIYLDPCTMLPSLKKLSPQYL